MTPRRPFEALVLRYRHDALLGESVNLGVVVSCDGQIATRFAPTLTRVAALFPDCNKRAIRRLIKRLQDAAVTSGEPLFPKTASHLLSQVLPQYPHAIAVSEPVVGVTLDVRRTCDSLYETFVASRLTSNQRSSRQDEEVWAAFEQRSHSAVRVHLQPHDLRGPRMPLHFDHCWKNGKWHAAQPLSFDLLEPHAIRDKAASWIGKLNATKPSEHGAEVSFLIGMPGDGADHEVVKAANDGEAMLRELLSGEADVYTEAQSADLERKILADLAAE